MEGQLHNRHMPFLPAFVAPTLQFFVGLALGEVFTPMRALSFAFIWAGVAVFAWGAWSTSRKAVTAPAE